MLNQVKKLIIAFLVCSFVVGFSSIPISGTNKDGYPYLYINFLDIQFKDNVFNLSEDPSNIENSATKDIELHLNLAELLLRDFVLLTNQRTSQHIKNHQENYQTILESTKETLIESIKFDMNKEEEKEKIRTEIEEEATDFLEDLLLDETTK